jgi:hypothetical protein
MSCCVGVTGFFSGAIGKVSTEGWAMTFEISTSGIASAASAFSVDACASRPTKSDASALTDACGVTALRRASIAPCGAFFGEGDEMEESVMLSDPIDGVPSILSVPEITPRKP